MSETETASEPEHGGEEKKGVWDYVKDIVPAGAELLHAGYEIAEHGATAANFGGGSWLGPLGSALGLAEIGKGGLAVSASKDAEHFNEGAYDILKGLGGVVGGLGATVGNPQLAVGGAGFTGGVVAGNYLDKGSKAANVFGDVKYGKPQGISDWTANNGVAANEWVHKHGGGDTLADVAGIAATLGSTLPVAWGPAAIYHKLFGGGDHE